MQILRVALHFAVVEVRARRRIVLRLALGLQVPRLVVTLLGLLDLGECRSGADSFFACLPVPCLWANSISQRRARSFRAPDP